MKGSEEYVINQIIAENYEKLAMAIVKQAADDLRTEILRAQNLIKKRKRPAPSALLRIKRLEEFFDSDWYKILCSMDGPYIVKKIEEELEWDYEADTVDIERMRSSIFAAEYDEEFLESLSL